MIDRHGIGSIKVTQQLRTHRMEVKITIMILRTVAALIVSSLLTGFVSLTADTTNILYLTIAFVVFFIGLFESMKPKKQKIL